MVRAAEARRTIDHFILVDPNQTVDWSEVERFSDAAEGEAQRFFAYQYGMA